MGMTDRAIFATKANPLKIEERAKINNPIIKGYSMSGFLARAAQAVVEA